MQAQGDIGILGGIFRSLLDGDLAEANLFCALAGDVLIVDGFQPKILACNRIHVVSRRSAVQHIRLEHGVEAHPLQRNAVVQEYVRVVLQVVPNLANRIARENGLQSSQRCGAIQLNGHPRIVMAERHIGRFACFKRERDSDNFSLHVVERGGFSIESKQVRSFQAP